MATTSNGGTRQIDETRIDRSATRTFNQRNLSMSTAPLLWGMLFGAIGVGFFIYGKRQSMITPLLCGIALVIYPWFVSSVLWLIVIGVVLMAIPWFVRY